MIRELRWNDFDDLLSSYYSYYEELENHKGVGIVYFNEKPTLEHEINWFSTLHQNTINGNAVVKVAEEDGHAVGICDVHRNRPGTEVSHLGVLGIAIRKEYRGRGIGKALIEECLKECGGKFHQVILSVFDFNKGAIHLYEKLGFTRYGVMPNAVFREGVYHDEILMYYRLD